MSGGDLTVFGNQLPAEMRELLVEDLKSDLARLGSTGDGQAIRITPNKKFQFADDTTHDGPIDVIIVDFVYRNEYYTSTYNAKEIVPPTCFAVAEDASMLTPSPRSPKVQVKEGMPCSSCQWDAYGTHPSGRGKACKNTIYLAVLPADATEKTKLRTVKVSPTGMSGFNAYTEKVGKLAQLPVYGVVTALSFDPNMSYPTLQFEAVSPNPILALTKARREEARALLMREPDFSGS